MGARHKGDIAHLCTIAQPNIGVVLKVALPISASLVQLKQSQKQSQNSLVL
jgi:UDP-N-acetylmuramyl pentapeptide synthase